MSPFAFLPVAIVSASAAQIPSLNDLDVVWTTPSVDAAGSMPIGNGEVVLNAWTEQATGDLMLLIARTDSLSEVSQILKLGRLRVHLSPSPFHGAADFRQHLRLKDGYIDFTAKGAKLRLIVDSSANVVHLNGSFATPTRVKATIECWRNAPRKLPKAEQVTTWSVRDAPFDPVESADVFVDGPGVTWYHRNTTSIVPKLWELQSLAGLKGAFDPLVNRTFGGRLESPQLTRQGDRDLATDKPTKRLDLRLATYTAQTKTVGEWLDGLTKVSAKSTATAAAKRTRAWWNAFWDRSWVAVLGDTVGSPVPTNAHPLRKGVDSNGQNRFQGDMGAWAAWERVLPPQEIEAFFAGGAAKPLGPDPKFAKGFTLAASIVPHAKEPGRIFDKLTAGSDDGFLFDTHPGDALRLIVGKTTLVAPHCLEPGKPHRVAATYDPATGKAVLVLDGKVVAQREGEQGSMVTRGYVLQRYVQACQGRGQYPIKFNGGYYTVEPKAMGMPYGPDFRRWGDCHWLQNVRHTVHPMMASGDFEMTEAFFRLYESSRALCESRAKAYHGCEGVYFPETMSDFGTYSGGDYGWDRTGLQPKDVQCPWWANAWNQGPEIVALMLDRWDYTRDEAFLRKRVLPMAESVLRYFDTRFQKDAQGRVVLDPTQVVETYWNGVVNDMPTTAGLIAITERLCALPNQMVKPAQRAFFEQMRKACPELPIEVKDGLRELGQAQRYKPEESNCENAALYAVWPFRLASLSRPALLEEAKRAYAHRKNRLDAGWGYDGNAAALLGMADEAARILQVKVRNSHPAYRWPATWGPNFDWLPDQNHGGNLLNTTNLMLLQAEPLEQGGAILLLPAWPKAWDVDFKLHAPGATTVRCVAKSGRIVKLEVSPASRAKDVVWPSGWARPTE